MKDWLRRIGLGTATGCLLGVVASTCSSLQSQPAYCQADAIEPASESGLQVISTLLPSGIQQLAIVEPRAKSMAVYHVDPTSGKIQLKSARSLVWDLQMEYFNGQAPLPSELRQVQP